MTYQPGSDKVDGYGYVKVKPNAMLDQSQNMQQGPYYIREMGDHQYYPHHYYRH
jgi:hypothetical protein